MCEYIENRKSSNTDSSEYIRAIFETMTNESNAMYVAQNASLTDGLRINYLTSPLTAGSNTVTTLAYNGSCWDFWQNRYYPDVIRESYPVYIQERAQDKGKQAFEIIKQLQDKRLMKLEKVSDFIDAMDCLIKIL